MGESKILGNTESSIMHDFENSAKLLGISSDNF